MKNITSNLPELVLYRKRLIPEECLPLPDDVILHCDEDILVTSWKTIRPKKDLDHGYSCYYLEEGYKVSKFYRADNTLLFYYCDIISPRYDAASNSLYVTDLLADVVIYPDGFIKVVDLDELVTAMQGGSLSLSMLTEAILTLDRLLRLLYGGRLRELLAPIDQFEP